MEEEKVSFGSQFQKFQSWLVDSVAFGPVVTQFNMVGVHGKRNLFTSWDQEAKREKRLGFQWPLQVYTSNDLTSSH
jgi:hypothetical protein